MAKLKKSTKKLGTKKKSSLSSRTKRTSTNKNSDMRSRFQRRKDDVLQESYEKRDKRSTNQGGGRSIFNQKMLDKYNIKVISKPPFGEFFCELLPVSDDPNVPYFLEVPVHGGVGLANDNFICMQRWQHPGNNRCFRCEEQKKLYQQLKSGSGPTDEIKKMYPSDRVVYLTWDRTDEFSDDGDGNVDYQLTLWPSPKGAVHSSLQAKVRDKRTKKILDIADVQPDGDGRTVCITVEKNKGGFPDYKDFELLDREEPIPDEIIEQLLTIIDDAKDAGFNNALEMFLSIPTYDDVKNSMLTEMDEIEEEENDDDFNDQDDGDIEQRLEQLQEELLDMKELKFRMWCKKEKFDYDPEVDREDAVDEIIDYLFENSDTKKEDIPF